MVKAYIFSILSLLAFTGQCQTTFDSLLRKTKELSAEIDQLSKSELVQSMSQRSLFTPSYFPELKALIARQAYNFWTQTKGEKYVSHLNVYSALYYANRFLGYDSINRVPYNQAVGHTESVTSIQFGSDALYFYSAGSDGRVIRWNRKDFKEIPEIIYEGDHLIRKIDVSHDGKWLMIVTKDQGVKLLDMKSLEMGNAVIEDQEPVQTAIFVPGALQYISVTKSGEIKVKGINGELITGKTDEQVNTLAVSEENNELFIGSESGNIQIWTDTLEFQFFIQEAFAINSMAISPDHQLLAIGREKGDVILWNINEKKLIRSISSHQSAIMEVNFSPDGRYLLTASRDKTARIWDLQDGRKLPLLLDDHDDWVMTAVFDPSGKYVITGSKDKMIRILPTDHEELANRICQLVERNLTEMEWEEYVGESVPYQTTCQ